MSADCRHGLHACPKASACDCSGPRTIPTRPSLLARLRTWWQAQPHRRAFADAIADHAEAARRCCELQDALESARLSHEAARMAGSQLQLWRVRMRLAELRADEARSALLDLGTTP